MKNSGIEWIGEIPDNWEIIPNKYLFENHSVKVGATWDKYKLLSLTTMGVKEKDSSVAGGKVPDSYENYQTVVPGDMIFCLFDLDCSAVFSGVSPYYGMITSAYDVYEINKKLADNLYVDYLFQYAFSNRYYKIYSKNIRYTVTTEMFKSIRTPIPPLDTQMKIGTLLSNKCSKVDKLIEVQQAQIEKLKEYKQAVITEAVTKGLDKSAPMKDSGVEWIGEIPEDWSIQKILYQLKMPITDGPHTTPELFSEGVAFVSAEAVSCGNGRIDFNHIRGYISEEFYRECCLKYIPEMDDVYMIKSGATTGRVSIVTTLEPKFTIWSPLAVMRCDKSKMIPKYLYYAVQSIQFQGQVALGWSFGTQQNLGMRTLEQLKILVPNIEIQQQVADYLDKNCADIEKLIEIKQKKIDMLNEYKKSLIYEYVTGKKEVV